MEGMAKEHLGKATAHPNVVDVGCGAGFTAAAMSALADRVLATDLTPEMVEQARRVGHERDAAGMSVAIAAASSLPVRSGSVDLLTCRYAFHHMVEAEQVLGEFHRVLTDEGCFLLADTVATEDPDVYQWMDTVERLRDPSHHLNRSPSELLRLIEECGFRITEQGTSRVHLDLESWVKRSATPPAEIEKLRSFVGGGWPRRSRCFRDRTRAERDTILLAGDGGEGSQDLTSTGVARPLEHTGFSLQKKERGPSSSPNGLSYQRNWRPDVTEPPVHPSRVLKLRLCLVELRLVPLPFLL